MKANGSNKLCSVVGEYGGPNEMPKVMRDLGMGKTIQLKFLFPYIFHALWDFFFFSFFFLHVAADVPVKVSFFCAVTFNYDGHLCVNVA